MIRITRVHPYVNINCTLRHCRPVITIAVILGILSSCSTFSHTETTEDSLLLRIQIGEKYGFIDENGKIVIEPQFDDASLLFSEGLCYVQMNNKKGLIDRNGIMIVELPDSVNGVSEFKDGVANIYYNKLGLNIIDRKGVPILKKNLFSVHSSKDDKNIYLFCSYFTNEDQDLIIRQDEHGHFSSNCQTYITDINGHIIRDSLSDTQENFSQNLCAVKIHNKWGYINSQGIIVIDTIYDYAENFSQEGLAFVRKFGKEYFINTNGETIISADRIITGFSCNRAIVEMDGKKYLINSNGSKIAKIEADKVGFFNINDKLASIVTNNKVSKIDTLGNIILQTDYERIGEFINGVALAIKNKKRGYINLEGKEIIPVVFNRHIDALHLEKSNIRGVIKHLDGKDIVSYYDLDGNLVAKDQPLTKYNLPEFPSKEDFKLFFDDNLSELDPIEGIYYVTAKDYYQNYNNPNIVGLNNADSDFFAVIKSENDSEYMAYLANESGEIWVNKFVKIGDSNNYAILSVDDDSSYSSPGKMTLDDPYQFEFRLERGNNSYYNLFVIYEFEKDYPPISEYEKIQKAEWTGSGFAIADSYIATNYHVTTGAKSIRIKGVKGDFNKSYKAAVVASDKKNDIAILKIVDKDFDSFGKIPYRIGKTIVDAGENIFVLGYPKIDTMGEEIKVTEGIISSSTGFQGNNSMYQISAAVQPGNSGGPLFDDTGTIIGIVCAKHADAENANYAVKISALFSLINSSNLGIKMADNDADEKKISGIVKKVKNHVYLIECNSR